MANFEWIRKHYGVLANYGRAVIVGGKPGVIVEDMGNYIGVLFDGDKPTNILPCHPTSEVEYGEMKQVRQMTRSQKRYRRFKSLDLEITFSDYLKNLKYYEPGHLVY